MLNEPILATLPASEEEIIAAFPRVNPDVILRRIRLLERAADKKAGGYIKKKRNGKFYFVKPPEDKEEPKRDDTHKMHERTCEACNTTYLGIQRHFGSRKNKVCVPCREKIGKTRLCRKCKQRKPVEEFRRRWTKGTFTFAPHCQGCRIV